MAACTSGLACHCNRRSDGSALSRRRGGGVVVRVVAHIVVRVVHLEDRMATGRKSALDQPVPVAVAHAVGGRQLVERSLRNGACTRARRAHARQGERLGAAY
eukprot:839451-Pleurochrysis_carterae.AAC.2